MKTNPLTAKHLGELAEERFKLIARSLGLIVCKPETQLSRYDFIVDLAGIPGLKSQPRGSGRLDRNGGATRRSHPSKGTRFSAYVTPSQKKAA